MHFCIQRQVRSPGNIHNLWDEVNTETAPGHSLDLRTEVDDALLKTHDPFKHKGKWGDSIQMKKIF